MFMPIVLKERYLKYKICLHYKQETVRNDIPVYKFYLQNNSHRNNKCTQRQVFVLVVYKQRLVTLRPLPHHSLLHNGD